jgi:ribosomal protein L11 methyltransferase
VAARTVPCLDLQFPSPDEYPELADRVSLALDDLSPAAIHETGDDAAPIWRVFLADPSHVASAAAALAAAFAGLGLTVSVVDVEDEDWAARSQAHLTRVPVGRVTVAPPWDAAPPPDGVLVVVYPSTGFGTGHHQTTRLCLRMLQDVPLSGRRVVDLGTGSGVLAIAAWRLGASDVEALDYDADAIVNALENLRLNGAEGAISMRLADLRVDAVSPADVVTANLTGALLVAQAPAIAALVRPGGTLVVSGILAPEIDEVRSAFAPDLIPVDDVAEDAWRALRFVRS